MIPSYPHGSSQRGGPTRGKVGKAGKAGKKSANGAENARDEDVEMEDKDGEKDEREEEFTRTYDVARGADSLAVRREMEEVVVSRRVTELPDSISLQPITLTDQEREDHRVSPNSATSSASSSG